MLAGAVLVFHGAAASGAAAGVATAAGHGAAARLAQICRSAKSPGTARTLSRAVQNALSGRTGIESVAVYDRKRKLSCAVDTGRHYDSASVVKVTILSALLRKAQEQGRRLTARERGLAEKMITRSDNAAATTLWNAVGRTRLNRFLKLAGMRSTRLGANGHWGLTQITASDELRLLRLLTSRNSVLTTASRRYVLDLMGRVIPEQRWGTPAGRPSWMRWRVKNGWLPRLGRYWRVHSIGAFDGRGENYLIVVLTQDSPTMEYGVQTIERVARAVHRTLNPRSGSVTGDLEMPLEASDGSVPADV
ncbi:serine hydrolase [Actinomadura sp. NBRC 104425]|uniref:serine hydrolase n=1 Tax=Actinomadura sp. NBRC 104425 TaxID=3032204 RepID=UPI00255267D5|nr:serine hydrolase [Actinomadura sp. NBRC 104425]